MNSAADSATSASLLVRLRNAPRDQAAWREFVQRYGGLIYGWCRSWSLQEADAQDVTQIVLLKLADKMRAFTAIAPAAAAAIRRCSAASRPSRPAKTCSGISTRSSTANSWSSR